MKKTEIASALATKHALTKKKAAEIIDDYWETTAKQMKKGDDVEGPYGKFTLKKRAARVGRNPSTGAKVKIPAKVVPHFKPNKKFKEYVGK